ncbi:MAG: MBL fold metallo-hydrolase [Chlorobi bacterium]|nr:MBL fold metallo-hydrolase [Chlorobiota bacterium]
MIEIQTFVFNSFSVNTYLLYDSTGKCVIIDAACQTTEEIEEIVSFIAKHNLKPEILLNTHCHVDHILGNMALKKEFNLRVECHKDDVFLLNNAVEHAHIFGFKMENPPMPDIYLDEEDCIKFGQSVISILHVPGHSPGSLAFFNQEQKFIITGDTLFHGSIGRTDLQGGNHEQLMYSINTKILPLGDTYTIFPGHGENSTIGVEKKLNPFLNGYVN